MKYYPVASTSELDDTGQLHVELNAEDILLCRDGNDYYAISYYCSHETFTLEGGLVENRCITCPYHGAEFSLETGEVLAPPAWQDIRTYPITIKDNVISIGMTE